jgi:hypothetical protein
MILKKEKKYPATIIIDAKLSSVRVQTARILERNDRAGRTQCLWLIRHCQ